MTKTSSSNVVQFVRINFIASTKSICSGLLLVTDFVENWNDSKNTSCIRIKTASSYSNKNI